MRTRAGSLNDQPPPTIFREILRRFVNRWLPTLVLLMMIATLVAILLYPRMAVTVPSGEVGVLWKRFEGGTVLDPRELKQEGLHIIMPWDRLYIYNLRVQALTETYGAISRDGVNMVAALNTRYRLAHDSIPTLHQVVGPDYEKILGPMIASLMREVIAEYTAEQVYSTARQEIQIKIRERALEKLGHKMMERELHEASYNVAMRDTVVLYDTLLFGIELPESVVNAINRKAEQYYIAEEYNFRLLRETRESERKRIEAQGIRDFQTIVSKGISDSYLRWRGVEATLQLAQSTNSKVVIIGGGKDGLPIILGNVDSPPATAPQTAPEPKNGAESAHVTPAAETGTPLERTPAGNLATPTERLPAAEETTGSGHASTDQATDDTTKRANTDTTASDSGSMIPFGLSDIAAYYLGMTSPVASKADAEPKQSPPDKATNPQHWPAGAGVQ